MLSYEDFTPKFARPSGLLNRLVGTVDFETFDLRHRSSIR